MPLTNELIWGINFCRGYLGIKFLQGFIYQLDLIISGGERNNRIFKPKDVEREEVLNQIVDSLRACLRRCRNVDHFVIEIRILESWRVPKFVFNPLHN